MPTKVRKFAHAFAAAGDDQPPAALESKKRKVGGYSGTLPPGGAKSSKRFAPIRGGRQWTISIAVPGSMLSNLATAEQRLATVARLARSLAIFCVDEVIIYDDAPPSARTNTLTRFAGPGGATEDPSYTGDADPCHFVAQLLSFLECPPFMRRRLFPLHPNLRHTALLPAVDMPHHPHAKAPWLPYAEGVTVPAEEAAAGGGHTLNGGAWVDTGLGGGLVHVKEVIAPNTRVTLRFDGPDGDGDAPAPPAACTHPDAPRTEGGYYWGYAVRRSPNLSAVFTECPYEGGYDVSVGTSERGVPLSQAMANHRDQQQKKTQQHDHWRHGHGQNRHGYGGYNGGGYGGGGGDGDDKPQHTPTTPSFRHLLVVFGGPRGIELAASHDPHLAALHIRGAKTAELFDHWVNVLPGQQGSWAVATDEAVPIALMGLRGLWESEST